MKTSQVDLNGLVLKNPVTVASGTFGFGREYEPFFDISKLGAISVKGLTLEPREGNPGRRLIETPMGLINSVGLQNPGVEAFIKEELPYLRDKGTAIIANINGHTLEEYVALADRLKDEPVDSIELNVSCPNVAGGGMAFGTDPIQLAETVRAVRKVLKDKHLIVKLTPNVTDIGEMARICEGEGADALSLINTLTGMDIDIYKRKPFLERKYGGLSGPAVKPVALKLVHDVYQATSIPVLGMGGIATWEDGISFLLAGATAIAVGTANFTDPCVTMKILDGMMDYAQTQGFEDFGSITGNLK